MAATLATGKSHCRSHLPAVNLFDIPELMRGARSSATPSQRMDFEQRCLRLHADDMKEQRTSVAAGHASHIPVSHITVDELEAMFSMLEPTLVRALADDAGTPQQAMETLLALAAAAAEPTAPPLPPRDLGLEDIDAFPSLVDAEGWQVPSQHLFDRNLEDDLGSAWRDRAKAAADKPAPLVATKPISAVGIAKKRGSKQREEKTLEEVHPEGEYELRDRLGKQRLSNRARFRVARGATPVPTDAVSELSETSSEEEADPSIQNDAAEDM